MIESVGLRAKTYAYLMQDDSKKEKVKGAKICLTKRILRFNNYKKIQSDDEITLKLQQRFKNDYHNVYAKQINEIALSSNGDRRLQTFDKIATYSYGINTFKVCESEVLSKYK